MAVHFDYSKESFWKQLLPKNFQGTKAQSVQVNTPSGVSVWVLLLLLVFVGCDSPIVELLISVHPRWIFSAIQLVWASLMPFLCLGMDGWIWISVVFQAPQVQFPAKVEKHWPRAQGCWHLLSHSWFFCPSWPDTTDYSHKPLLTSQPLSINWSTGFLGSPFSPPPSRKQMSPRRTPLVFCTVVTRNYDPGSSRSSLVQVWSPFSQPLQVPSVKYLGEGWQVSRQYEQLTGLSKSKWEMTAL